MTGRSVSWQAVFNYLEDRAEAKPNSAEYATKVCKLYDVLVEKTGDAEGVREFLLFHMSMQQHRGLISKQHQPLLSNYCPNLPADSADDLKALLGTKLTTSGTYCTKIGSTKRLSIHL
jgi:hypothetical protein